LSPSREPDLEQWEDRVEVDIREDTKIPETEAEAIIQARVGQGRFRADVQGVERACRVTKMERLEHLLACIATKRPPAIFEVAICDLKDP
jgi:hypothetical protein